MASDTIQEASVREALADLIESDMTGVGQPVEIVFHNWVRDFGPSPDHVGYPSPVVMVQFGGVSRVRRHLGATKYKSRFRMMVWIFVMDAEGSGWTDAEVDAKVSEIEKRIADLVANNTTNPGNWNHITYENEERPGEMPVASEVGGNRYVRMRVPLIVEVLDD